MTCREVIDFLMRYIDGDLPEEQRAQFEKHLGLCPCCVNFLDSYKATVRLGRECFHQDAPPPTGKVPESMIAAIVEALKHS